MLEGGDKEVDSVARLGGFLPNWATFDRIRGGTILFGLIDEIWAITITIYIIYIYNNNNITKGGLILWPNTRYKFQ